MSLIVISQFWLTVEEYKLLPSDAPEKAHRAQDIYQRFFTPQSRSEVNITAKMRDQIADRVVFHSDNLFDDPQKEVRMNCGCQAFDLNLIFA